MTRAPSKKTTISPRSEHPITATASAGSRPEILGYRDSGLFSNPIAAWLVNHDGAKLSANALLDELCDRLIAGGVPLFRVAGAIPLLHPQLLSSGLAWMRGRGTSEVKLEHGLLDTVEYRDSPVALIHQGAAAIRRRLDIAEPQMDFPILHELKALGATDYLILPLRFTRSRPMHMSWATDRPGGFASSELALLSELMPLIALRFEIETSNQMMRDLMTTYLGRDAAEKVLGGTVRRGQGQAIDAAIWYCDLRGFTAMADSMKPRDLIVTLDEYLECMARPVQALGGEVLKFVGDAMLAIFRVDNQPAQSACDRALKAAIDAIEGLHELNQGRALEGGAPLDVGIALHMGEVIYGNIGARDRLDFTVIGSAVNEVVRVGANCGPLGRSILTSAEFAKHCRGHPLESLGLHMLRGLPTPRELHGLAVAKVD